MGRNDTKRTNVNKNEDKELDMGKLLINSSDFLLINSTDILLISVSSTSNNFNAYIPQKSNASYIPSRSVNV